MKKIKICLTTIEFPPDPGGVGQSVMRIGNMLQELDFEVHIVVCHTRQAKEILNYPPDSFDYNRQRSFNYEQQDGMHVYRSNVALKSDVNIVPEFLSDVYHELIQLHKQVGFDVFHSFFLNETGFLTTLVANELGVPVINSIRGSDLHKNVFNYIFFNQIVWALEHTSWATFVSNELRNRAHVIAPSIIGKTSAFWNSVFPVDFGALEPLDNHGDKLNKLVIGAVGNFRDKKGIDYLIRACAELKDEISTTLLLVGDFVEKEKFYWSNFLKESGIEDSTIVTGMLPREQALQYLNYIDIFTIPSLRDGCPNSLLEAMLAGKAIIGSNVDAIGEIIDNGKNGISVKPGSTSDLVKAISQLAKNTALRKKLGENARQTAITQLSPEVEKENWLKVYNHVLKDTTKPQNLQSMVNAIAG